MSSEKSFHGFSENGSENETVKENQVKELQLELQKMKNDHQEQLKVLEDKLLNITVNTNDKSQSEQDGGKIENNRNRVTEWINEQEQIKTINTENKVCQNNLQINDFIARQATSNELPQFSGDPLEWPVFFAEFINSTKICNFNEFENIIRLRKCLIGKAKDAVQSLLIFPKNVDKIIDILQMRFGNPVHIVRNLMDKIKNIPNVRDDKIEEFLKFYDVFTNLIYTLEALNYTDYLKNPLLFEEILNKLPVSKRVAFLQYFDNCSENKIKLNTLHEWLSRQVKAISQLTPSTNDDNKQKTKGTRPRELTLTTVTTSKKKSPFCSFCGTSSDHFIQTCNKFKTLSIDDRWLFVTKNFLCISCLGKNHSSKNCKFRQTCNIDKCQRPHNKLLHKQETDITKNTNQEISEETDKNYNINNLKKGQVLLKIIPITIDGPNKSISTYALLDDASTTSLMDQNLADTLELTGPIKPLSMQWINNLTETHSESRVVSLLIRGNQNNSKTYRLRHVKTVSNLSLPSQKIDIDVLQQTSPFLNKFKYLSHCEIKPMLLIGQDNWPVIITYKTLYGHWNGPAVSKTKLGWVIHGNIPDNNQQIQEYTCTTNNFNFNINQNFSEFDNKDDLSVLHDLIKDQWKLDNDNIMTKETQISQDDKRSIEIMDKTLRRIDNNKFECGLLWKTDDIHLPESYKTALMRLHSLESRMDKDPQYADLYCTKFEDYIRKGYIKKLTADEADTITNLTFYLPHFGVVNSNKPGKLRIVFDAAAKTQGYNLNDFLLTGPDLYNSLSTILLNFRNKPLAFVGDIQEMFLQIAIKQEDRHAQRILWRGMSRDRKPDIFEIQVLFFGAKCSPSISQEVKNKNALEFKENFPMACDEIIYKHYMDDYLGGADSIEEAVQLINDVISIHKKAGFNMTNWISNSKQVLEHIQSKQIMTKCEKQIDGCKEERILGLWWDYDKDIFTYRFKFQKIDSDLLNLKRRPTKRDTLKVVMSMFDPLGFIANYLIMGKILLQSIWDSGISWDDVLPDEQFNIWKDWISKLSKLRQLTIPRQVTTLNIKQCKVHIHVFCDASKYAYASCAYIRFQYNDKIECNLILAKTRVAPLKTSTIPRLELQAALLGARILKQILDNLEIKIHNTFLWSDSEIVLNWIKTSSRKFKIYVGQRIGEIHDLTNSSDWNYVPTKLNVADDATKLKPIDISNDSRWLKGPSFLYEDSSKWPKKNYLHDNTFNETETNEYINVMTENTKFNLPDVTRFSKWFRFLRTMAWVLRFINLIKLRKQKTKYYELQPEELKQAEILIYRQIQSEFFFEELKYLKTGKLIPRDSQLSSLTLTLDPNGLIRLKGRLENVKDEDFDYNSQHPIILPSKHPIVILIMNHFHEQNSHIGIDKIVTDLRKIYWIIGCKNAVKKIAFTCQYCKNKKAKPLTPVMGQLPSCRVNVTCRPFIKTGVDYFGPYEVSVNRKIEKRYGVLFTCMTTRAVHLEIANDLSSNAFIHVWRQFGCRRGFPTELFSDNGTNFHKAHHDIEKALNDWPHESITREMTMKNCKWTFNPPAAPHMGGAWERLIRSVKAHLHFLLKERHPKEFTLRTLFCEIENILNSRPLIEIPLSSDDAIPLTPNDLLIGPMNTNLQFTNTFKNDMHFLNMWRTTQRLVDMFWQRWRKEYRQYLICNKKWKQNCLNLREGDVVLITDPNALRNIWPKGIIKRVYPSKDGQVRIVDVKTSTGVYRRPVHKLIKLEIEKKRI